MLIKANSPELKYEKFGYQIIVKHKSKRLGTIIKSNIKTIDQHIENLKNDALKFLNLLEF